LDRIDIKVLGQLYRGVSRLDFRPDVNGLNGRIAKKLALDEDTVRRRVDRLESIGVIQGWELVVNPEIFGLITCAVWMTVDSQIRIEEAIRKTSLVPGIFTIALEMGNILSIGLVCENERVFSERVTLISELTKGKELIAYVVAHPKTEIEPTSTDWQIINAFRPDPLVRYTRVAEKLDLSSRTIQKRITKLAHGNAIFFLPNIDFSLLEGALCVGLVVCYADGGFKDQVERSIFTKFEDYVLQVAWGDASHGYFQFVIPNVLVVQEIVHCTRALKGVKDVKVNLNYNRLMFYDAVQDDLIASKVKSATALRAS
jgi:DNA-binding Lrp family transcriptional regulator